MQIKINTLKKTLGEIEKELDEKFFRIGRSAIVNLKYITRIQKQKCFYQMDFLCHYQEEFMML